MKSFSKMKHVLLLSVVVLTLIFSSTAHAGKIVLANDEWTLSNTGFFAPNDPTLFAQNVGSWFKGADAGNFLAYSSNFGLTESSLAAAMTAGGNTWTVSTNPILLSSLSSYNGLFLTGTAVNTALLIDYVNAGGNVYLAGGTGWGGAAAEAAQWNPFLNAFGLGFAPSYNGVGGSIAISSTHPIFNGVDYLYQNNGNDGLDINVLDSRGQVIVSVGGHGLYAVYDSDANNSAVPEPGTLLLLGSGMLSLAGIKGFRSKNS